jgi:predicted  nucleic acid-binding Zn-ribbon protein
MIREIEPASAKHSGKLIDTGMQTENDWLPNGGFQPRRYRPGGVGNWSGHLPFANDLIAAARPKLLVELGTHYGESYFGFCQAITENNVACLAYAVDTWVGEPHAGYYDERVFSDVNRYNEANYSSFSQLLRTTFDEANAQFADDSIDILHIDGLHTYDAVSHDFHSWLPKVRPGGIILLHDIVGRHEDFGVWKLWDELEGLGDRFAFTHSSGLGVFRKPGPILSGDGFLRSLFEADRDRRDHIRRFYSLCALKLEYEYARTHLAYAPISRALVHVYPFLEAGYSAETVYTADFKPGQWQHITIDLASGIGNGPLRIDLAEQPAIIDLAGIRIRKAASNEVLWSAQGLSETASLALGGTMTRFEIPDRAEFCCFLSFGSDPQLFLPYLDANQFDQPLQLDIWVRLHVEISSLMPRIRRLADSDALKGEERLHHYEELQSKYEALAHTHEDLQRAHQDLQKAHEDLRSTEQDLNKTYENLQAKYRELAANREALANEHAALRNEHTALRNEYAALENQHAALGSEHASLRDQHAALADESAVLKKECAALQKDHGALEKKYEAVKRNYTEIEQTLQGVLASHSWRITAPLRNVMLHLRPRGK